jgi:hypothetical protein
MHGYADTVFGPQRDGGDRLNGMTGNKVEMKLLLDHHEQRGLQHGKGCSDTYSRTATKREIGESCRREGKRPRPTTSLVV